VDGVVVRADKVVMQPLGFSDEPLMVSGDFALHAQLDGTAPAATLGTAIRIAAETLIKTDAMGNEVTDAPEGRFLLDSLDGTLRSSDYGSEAAIALADALAQERAVPSGTTSADQSLDSLLAIRNSGAIAVAIPQIVELTREDLTQLDLHVDVGVELDDSELVVTWSPQRVEAAPAEGYAPAFVELAAAEATSAVASMSAERDLIELADASFGLPFGALAAQVLHRVVSFDAAGHGEEIRTAMGCDVLAEWLGEQTFADASACDAGCVQVSCDRAVARLVGAAETALIALDEARPTTTLRGELALGDEDGDLMTETMSSELLSGEWMGETESDPVDAISGPASAQVLAVASQ
jgi:hypothetical protein